MPQATKDQVQNFTVGLDVSDWRRLKIQAAIERRSMIAIVRDALRNYLDLHGSEDAR